MVIALKGAKSSRLVDTAVSKVKIIILNLVENRQQNAFCVVVLMKLMIAIAENIYGKRLFSKLETSISVALRLLRIFIEGKIPTRAWTP